MHLSITPSELLIGMLVVLVATTLLAEKIKIAYPILLVLAGLAMGVIPIIFPKIYSGTSSTFRVNPDIVFLIFLPPLLYYAGLLTTWRDFRANIRPISALAVGLVIVTMVAVAMVTKALVPSMDWAMCFLLGAIVSPPDAVAATAVVGKLPVPKRVITILEGESLVNDATALVAYRVALGVLAGGVFHLGFTTIQVLYVAAGGVVVGLLAAYGAVRLLSKIEMPAIESTFALLIPFAAYIPAEKLGVSGVLAAVAAGVYTGRRLPEIGSPRTRLRVMAVWDSLVFILNGVIFILIGLQLFDIVQRGLVQMSMKSLVATALAVSVTAIVVRVAYVFPMAYLARLIPSVARKEPRPSFGSLAVVSWSGMRGIVTLAAAFALPEQIGPPGARVDFVQRDIILFISFVVILMTLVAQGFTLGPLISMLGLKQNDDIERREEVQARLDAAHAAVSRLAVLSFDDNLNPEVISRVQAEYDERISRLGGTPAQSIHEVSAEPDDMLRKVRLEALSAERKMITFMRDQNILGDEVLRRILEEIDLEEAKLRS